MNASTRFVPRLEEIEGRFNPAALTPDAVFAAAAFARYDSQLVAWAADNPATVHAIGNQAVSTAVANAIISISPGIEQILSAYAAELQTESAAAGPPYSGFFNQYIALYTNLAADAQTAAVGAQAALNNIAAYNASLAASGTTGTGTTRTGATGTTGTGTTTGNLIGTGTGTTTTGTTTTGTSTIPTSGGSVPGTSDGTTPVGTGTGTGGTGGSSTTTTTPGSGTTGTGSTTIPGSSGNGTNGSTG